jgi:hypothetical protein
MTRQRGGPAPGLVDRERAHRYRNPAGCLARDPRPGARSWSRPRVVAGTRRRKRVRPASTW